MSWEVFVQVWLYTIVGFIVGVALTWLFGVWPVRRKLRALERERARSAQQPERQERTLRGEQPAAPSQAGAAAGAAAVTDTPTAERSQERVFAPRTEAQAPVPDEAPEEQTIVLEAFDFGGPDSRTQTRSLPEEDEDQPWQPEVRIDPNDRLSDQFAKRSPQPEPELPTRHDASGPDPLAAPAPEPAPFQDGQAPEQPAAFHARETPDGEAFSYLHEQGQQEPAQPDLSSGFPEPFQHPGQDADPLPQRRPGAAGAAAAHEGPLAGSGAGTGGSLFDPSADLNGAAPGGSHGEAPPFGPFGAGSALPRPDGSAPSPEFTVKARTSSMVFHTERSPFFDRLLPQVWFRSVEDAQRAGFAGWEEAHDS